MKSIKKKNHLLILSIMLLLFSVALINSKTVNAAGADFDDEGHISEDSE